jgi:hypothetical protein
LRTGAGSSPTSSPGGLVGTLISAQLVLAAPFDWAEAFAFGLPLTLVFGFAGLGAFWVCQAAPLSCRAWCARSRRSSSRRSVSAVLWLGAARGWAIASSSIELFPASWRSRRRWRRSCSGLGVALFLLTAALNYLLMAMGASQASERARCSSRSARARRSCGACARRSTRTSSSTA